MVDQLSPEEQTVLLPPYGNRLDRPSLRVTRSGDVTTAIRAPRDSSKKTFDRRIFQKDYF